MTGKNRWIDSGPRKVIEPSTMMNPTPGGVEADAAVDGVDGDCMLPFCRPPQRQRGT
jgi:hypothetical protein